MPFHDLVTPQVWSFPLRSSDEFGNNRGLVKAQVMLHGERGRIRVKIMDEDETESFFIDTPSRTAGANRDYDMPPIGSEIWAMLDAKGEDGVMISARHNDVDNNPTDDPNMRVNDGPWGSTALNKETGDFQWVLNGTLSIRAAQIRLKKGKT